MVSSRVAIYLFAGDSLTEGVYGENYVERVAKALYKGQVGLKGEAVNAGRGGDTVSSLLGRIDRSLHRYQPRWVILAIGSNDVWLPWLTSHSAGWWLWSKVHDLRFGQKPVSDLDHFAAAYRALIDKAQQINARVLACTVSPLGEKLSSPTNRRVARLNGVIKHVAAEAQVPVADIWQAFIEELALQPGRSGYLPGEWLFAWSDKRRMKRVTPDEVAERRRLYLTFDGIHLNSRGADLWAETVLGALAQAEDAPDRGLAELSWLQGLSCFDQGAVQVCATTGWEARAHDLAQLLIEAYGILSERTGARPDVRLAVLSRVDWNQSPSPIPYPTPGILWDGKLGTLFVPEAYEGSFLQAWHLPEAVAGWASWPPDLAHLGTLARVTALADLLAVQELTHLFLQELHVALADPALKGLLVAYLTQVVLHALDRDGASNVAGLWNGWGDVLVRAGLPEGQVRLQAKALFDEHGEDLIESFTGWPAEIDEQVTAALGTGVPKS
jgi:lysophospholipase L1-like esterase